MLIAIEPAVIVSGIGQGFDGAAIYDAAASAFFDHAFELGLERPQAYDALPNFGQACAGDLARDGDALVLDRIRGCFRWLQLVWADAGYDARQVKAPSNGRLPSTSAACRSFIAPISCPSTPSQNALFSRQGAATRGTSSASERRRTASVSTSVPYAIQRHDP